MLEKFYNIFGVVYS